MSQEENWVYNVQHIRKCYASQNWAYMNGLTKEKKIIKTYTSQNFPNKNQEEQEQMCDPQIFISYGHKKHVYKLMII